MDYEKDFLKIPRTCPFCKPKENDILKSNKSAYLTYALAPYHKDHLLVISKRHITEILDLTDEEVCDIYELNKEALIILKKLGYKDISVLIRDGDNTMKTVDHLHYNIIPNTRLGDIDHVGVGRVILTPEEISETITRIRSVI
ncbi:MAG: HIT domain-containing protein [Candidatus Paceibacterota bacterium]